MAAATVVRKIVHLSLTIKCLDFDDVEAKARTVSIRPELFFAATCKTHKGFIIYYIK